MFTLTRFRLVAVFLSLLCSGNGIGQNVSDGNEKIAFESLPDLPDAIGVAGALVGIHDDVLIVAGGANFAAEDDPDLWKVAKRYHKQIWALRNVKIDGQSSFEWQSESVDVKLRQPVAYSSVVNTPAGILCMGGENANGPTNRAFLLQAGQSDSGEISITENDQVIPDLPLPCTAGGAAIVGQYVYMVAGQVVDEQGNRAASRIVWRLRLAELNDSSKRSSSAMWEQVNGWPIDGPPRMFPLLTVQHDGFGDRLFVFGGRHFPDGTDKSDLNNLSFLSDGWSFDPGSSAWKRLADAPVPISAGTAVPLGPAHILVPSYATGSVLKSQLASDVDMKNFSHPGFPKTAYAYHTITDSWTSLGSIPANQVTTPGVRWGEDVFIISGEVRPRVRTNKAWRIRLYEHKRQFGAFNMAVVVVYLLAMVAIGVFFALRNKSTDDYFRGGKKIAWWAAGCSIFATMLSSITYMAIPAKAFAQDWVYAVGSLMILAVAPIAIYVALPFFRGIDATSAYEYLELRFNRACRLIGSGSFTLFHIFRIGVVLALAALALASVTPLNATQCVVVMGVLSIVYCTLGGIEAVIWTDTIQTFVLLGGALCCLFFALAGSDHGSLSAAIDAGKFHLVNLDFGPTSFITMSIWVVILGGLGQNVASYTADQAVVQRYMTTPDSQKAARSIWLNGLLALPAAVLFFGMGTAFWMFYRSHPEKLDPSIAADRIMPLFISQELPIGIAGLVVAGIFAAAQSTVSTSMNSGATTVVTDFVRPFQIIKTESLYLWLARFCTLAMGTLGTLAGLLFVDPYIRSLFDEYIAILGMFLGVLAGLFALGATTRRANGPGSLIGAFVAIVVMTAIVLAARDTALLGVDFRALFDAIGTQIYDVNGYLYAFVGITICYVVGYLASFAFPGNANSLAGLTLWDKTRKREQDH